MSKFQNFIVLIIKGIILIYIPIVILLYILYNIIFKIDVRFPWETLLIMGFTAEIIIVSDYKRSEITQEVEDFSQLKNSIRLGRWKFIDEQENRLTLRPRFDFPISLVIGSRVTVNYTNKRVIIEGPKNYIHRLKNDIEGKGKIWVRRVISVWQVVLIALVVSIPIINNTDIFWQIKNIRHNSYVKNIEIIDVNSTEIQGNTMGNIINHGAAVENEDYIFYGEDSLNLVRTNKELKDKKYLIQKSSGTNIHKLNIVGDWIYYVSGETLNRITLDGAEQETIYKSGYLLDLTIKNEWIYFINFADDYNIYKMDINGRNLQRFLKVNASDMAIYDDQMIFCYEKNGKGYVESINLDGTDRKLEFEALCTDLLKVDDFYYYMGEAAKLYRKKIDGKTPPEILIRDEVSSYIIIDENIYYSLQSKDVGYPGTDLYKIGLDGSDSTLLLNTNLVEGFAKVGNYLLFHSSEDDFERELKRLTILTDEIELVK